MSITYNQQGKITMEPTKGNVLGITEIVLQHFEHTLRGLERENPNETAVQLRRIARDELESNIETLTYAILESCRRAMMTRPEDVLRRDLVGRVLFHRLEDLIKARDANAGSFPRSYIEPVLLTLRTIIGETHYNNLNEHSMRPSLEYCVVHELGESKICWETFYNQNLVNILLTRIKNIIKRWIEEHTNSCQLFVETVNTHLSDEQAPFTEAHFEILMNAWGIHLPS